MANSPQARVNPSHAQRLRDPGLHIRSNLARRLAPRRFGAISRRDLFWTQGSPQPVHFQERRIPKEVEPPTRPGPIARFFHQPALDGIMVHVVELFQPLLFAVNIEGIEPPLPYPRVAQTSFLDVCGAARSRCDRMGGWLAGGTYTASTTFITPPRAPIAAPASLTPTASSATLSPRSESCAPNWDSASSGTF
jgi:hypothetical protein